MRNSLAFKEENLFKLIVGLAWGGQTHFLFFENFSIFSWSIQIYFVHLHC